MRIDRLSFAARVCYPEHDTRWQGHPYVRRILLAAVLLLHSIPSMAQVSAPRAVEAIALGRGEVKVYWLSATDAAGYLVRRDGTEIGRSGAADTSFTDTGARPGATYRYEVIAIDGMG